MSTSVNRLPYAHALDLAEAAKRILAPDCERVAIAGSIRRRKPDCGDIELVCIPRIEHAKVSTDLFGATTFRDHDLLGDRVRWFLATDRDWQPRLNKNGQKSVGSAMKLLTFRGFALDVFVCDPATWGVTFTIRTGSADFSHRLVTPTTQGGLCPPYLQFKGWRVQRRDGTEVLETPEEHDVFAALGLDYVEPEARA